MHVVLHRICSSVVSHGPHVFRFRYFSFRFISEWQVLEHLFSHSSNFKNQKNTDHNLWFLVRNFTKRDNTIQMTVFFDHPWFLNKICEDFGSFTRDFKLKMVGSWKIRFLKMSLSFLLYDLFVIYTNYNKHSVWMMAFQWLNITLKLWLFAFTEWSPTLGINRSVNQTIYSLIALFAKFWSQR